MLRPAPLDGLDVGTAHGCLQNADVAELLPLHDTQGVLQAAGCRAFEDLCVEGDDLGDGTVAVDEMPLGNGMSPVLVRSCSMSLIFP